MVASKIFGVVALAAAASAMPTSGAKPSPFTGPVTMIAIRSASPIHFGALTASGGNFFIDPSLKPSSYCPEQVSQVSTCPSGNYTAIYVSGTGFGMDVEVPGGQQGFVRADGSLGYTLPHSASQPQGSTPGGLKLGKKDKNNGLREITANGAFLACPKHKGKFPYQIYLDIKGLVAPSGNKKDCLAFANTAIEFTTETFGAWEY